jgi:hypothetical protein
MEERIGSPSFTKEKANGKKEYPDEKREVE